MKITQNKSQKSISKSHIWTIGIVLLLVSLFSNVCNLAAQHSAKAAGPCGDSYIVLPGDTIESIAALCGTTIDALLEINPEITDPDNLYPGQIIRIPEPQSPLETIVAISPACGLPGQSLLVVGSGYPVGATVQLKLTQEGGDTLAAGTATSDEFGMIDTSLIIPNTAQPGTSWVVTGQSSISTATFSGTSNKFHVIPEAGNPNSATTYFAQEGDTLIIIANKFNRNVRALQESNPQISERGQVSAGDLINIPQQEPGTPITTIAPICGPAETNILVRGTGFPPVTTITLSMGPYLVGYEQVTTTASSPNRTIQSQLVIPTTAQPAENWVVIAGTGGLSETRSTSNIFIVTPPKDPSEPALFIVKPGDSLNEIAAEYTRTVASILEVNPQITNPNQLEIGEKIIIPGQVETILISPISGPEFTTIQVAGIGYIPYSTVTVGLTRDSVLYSIEGSVTADVNGFFNTSYIIPPVAQTGEIWNVVSIKSDAAGGEITATSNDFTITETKPPLEPSLSLWPLTGPPGTSLSIVGSNYPSMSKILYYFGPEFDPTRFSSTTWTEINGTFAVDLQVPNTANPGEIWAASAESIDNQAIQTTSPNFSVTNP